MALTKIKLNTMVTGTLPDANIPDDITIDTAAAAPASGLTGNTLASGVTASSLTSVGKLTSLEVEKDITADTALTGLIVDLSKDTASANSNQALIGADIDIDITAIKDIHAPIKGLNIDVLATSTDTTSHTASLYGIDVDVTPYASSNETVYGIKVNVDDNTTTATDYGLHVTAANNYLSGNLGIGTSPSKPLHISSAENQVARFESTDAYAGIELKDNGSSTLPPLISALSDDILFYGGNASARPLIMTLDSSTANVGIGDTSPSTALTSFGSASKGLSIKNQQPTISFTDSDVTKRAHIAFEGGSRQLYISSPESDGIITFQTGGFNERMRINSSGFVGIGDTTSANALLDINKSTTSTDLPTTNESFEGYRLILANPQLTNNATNALGFSMYNGEVCASIDASTYYNGNYETTLRFQTRKDGAGGLKAKLIINPDGEFVHYADRGGLIGIFKNDHSSIPYGIKIDFDSATPNNTNQYFIACQDSTNDKFVVSSNGDVESRSNSFGGFSDERLKENIVDATPKLDELNQVRVVNYNFKDEPDKKQLGVIGQELQEIFPKMVSEYGEDGYLGVKYSIFVPMLIKAVQELSEKVEALENA